MYLDKLAEFADSQAVTATAISNVMDLTINGVPAVTDLGDSEDVYLVIQVDTTCTAGGAATVTPTLESDSAAGLNSAPIVHYQGPAIPVASLVAGYQVARLKLPSVGDPANAYKRYLGVRFTVATGPLTAGAFSAFLTKDTPSTGVVNYGSGFSVQ